MHQYGAHPSSAEETQPGSKQCENPRFHLCKEQGSVSKVFAMQTGHALPSPQTQVKKTSGTAVIFFYNPSTEKQELGESLALAGLLIEPNLSASDLARDSGSKLDGESSSCLSAVVINTMTRISISRNSQVTLHNDRN